MRRKGLKFPYILLAYRIFRCPLQKCVEFEFAKNLVRLPRTGWPTYIFTLLSFNVKMERGVVLYLL